MAVVLLGVFASLPLAGQWIGAPWLSLAVTYLAIPVLDHWVGPPRVRREPSRFSQAAARWVPRLYVAFHAAVLLAALSWAAILDWSELLIFALAVGNVTGGLGITVAHELGHRQNRFDRLLAKALLVSVGYGHFYVEHNRGHHVRVATPDDPATARRGQTVYAFWWQSVAGSWMHAWRLEAMRLAYRGRAAWHPSNWTLASAVLTATAATAIGVTLGPKALALFAVQAVFALTLLEIVNYIEHYGLERARIDAGGYEPVRPAHSWNANFAISNFLLFNLQLHADHHLHMDKVFDRLESMDEAPQLPAGYPTLVLASLLPPLWRALIDPRLPPDAGWPTLAA